jgi:hypothetical protein
MPGSHVTCPRRDIPGPTIEPSFLCVVVRRLYKAILVIFGIVINEDKTQGIYFSHSRRPPESHFTLNGQNISFVYSVKYLDVIFDKKVTWRLYIELIEAKAFRTFIRMYSLFKSERLSTNIKLTLHKALIRGIMTYVCPAWEFAAENHLLKLQRLQNKVLAQLKAFQGPHRFAICIWLSNFRIYIII